MWKYLSSLFFGAKDATVDTTIGSTRLVSKPAVNKVINSLAFQPPDKDSRRLAKLSYQKNHNYVWKDDYAISHATFRGRLDNKKVILFSHGNASDVLASYRYCEFLANIYGIDCVCYDYVGYGLSTKEGVTNPTEEGCYESIKIMVEYLREKYDTIYLMGQSLGTGVCIDYCSKNEWSTPVILISPYKSLVRVMFDSSLSSGLDTSFNTYEKLPNVTCPVKIIHGDADTLINISHGKKLYEKLNNKTLEPYWVIGAGHNDILEYIKYEHLADVFNSR